MKIYTWRDFNTYPYAGGMVVVVAENIDQARELATEELKHTVYHGSGFDISGEPDSVVPAQVGAVSAYYWEE